VVAPSNCLAHTQNIRQEIECSLSNHTLYIRTMHSPILEREKDTTILYNGAGLRLGEILRGTKKRKEVWLKLITWTWIWSSGDAPERRSIHFMEFFRTSIATAAFSANDTPMVKTAVLAYILKCQLPWKVKITLIKKAPKLADSTIS
jgi:hypothetical protein